MAGSIPAWVLPVTGGPASAVPAVPIARINTARTEIERFIAVLPSSFAWVLRFLAVAEEPLQGRLAGQDRVGVPDRVRDALLAILVDPLAHLLRALRDRENHDGRCDHRPRN